MQKNKKQYSKPRVSAHGSVEQITGYTGGGCNEFLGSQGTNGAFSCAVFGKKDLGS